MFGLYVEKIIIRFYPKAYSKGIVKRECVGYYPQGLKILHFIPIHDVELIKPDQCNCDFHILWNEGCQCGRIVG